MPADYFGKRGLAGDCTDQTNGTASVLRNLGYQAKGVFGYSFQGGQWIPHTWAEVVLDGKPFIVTPEGDLYPASADGLKSCNYKRPEPGDPRYAMWDETGQEPYVDSWWTLISTTTTTTMTTTTTPGDGSTPITGAIDFGQVPVPSGHTLDRYVTASGPSDPSDRRVYATYTRSYSSDSGPRFSISVWEYSVVDGQAISSDAYLVYSWDVGTATSRETAFSDASAAIAQRIRDMGLVVEVPS
jgi:transglutaminase-like putative cysteine protease